jgi:hypothetical protein
LGYLKSKGKGRSRSLRDDKQEDKTKGLATARARTTTDPCGMTNKRTKQKDWQRRKQEQRRKQDNGESKSNGRSFDFASCDELQEAPLGMTVFMKVNDFGLRK